MATEESHPAAVSNFAESDNLVQSLTDTSNPYVSPQTAAPTVTSQTSDEIWAAAQSRLYTPVVVCQLMMVLMLLGVGIWVGFSILFVTFEPEAARDGNDPWFFGITAIVVFFQAGLALIGLYGLRQAANLQSRTWAWVGLIISAIVGSQSILVLPFAIWGMVVLADADVKKAFRK